MREHWKHEVEVEAVYISLEVEVEEVVQLPESSLEWLRAPTVAVRAWRLPEIEMRRDKA